jgi:hypothetical protein
MLDYMRRNAQSIVIVFVLSVLILAFIIEFGPQSKGCRGDDPRTQQHAARSVMTVLGYEVTDLEFELWRMHVGMQPGLSLGQRYLACYQTATTLANFGASAGAANKASALDESEDAAHFRNAFLLREALVREAQRQGVAIDDEEIKHALSRGRIFIFDHAAWTDPSGGVHYCGGELPLRIGLGRDGKFSGTALRAALQQQFQMSVDDFYAFERRNLLALKMQQLLAAGVAVSPAEVEQSVRAETESVDLLVWTVGPSVGSDEEQSQLQARFDELRGQPGEGDVDLWLAQESNAKLADERAHAASGSVDGGFDPARGRQEIARSLMAVERLAQEVRDAARLARGLFARPEGAPETPPPVAEGLVVRSHTEALRPLAPTTELPSDLQDTAGIVERVLALTADSPVLADDLEREAVAASVQDAAGERYALREVLLVRRTGPWDLEAAVKAALAEKRDAATATVLAAKRAGLLEAWYATQLYTARANDNVDDQRLTEYLESLRQQH